MPTSFTPTILLILDGWGQAPDGPGNAVSLASTPNIDAMMRLPSRTLLKASGRSVGLPAGFMGNSEVGHMNMGAGRIVYQDMTRIDLAIEEGVFADNPVIRLCFEKARQGGGVLHLLGLLSDGGVHSHLQHIYALLEAAQQTKTPVRLHLFTDGRDTAPDSALGFMRELLAHLGPDQRVASVTGRYYAMDRDKHWERTQVAWDALVNGKAEACAGPIQAIEEAYANGLGDEFIPPRLIVGQDEEMDLIRDNDAVFFFNFRADRARQLCRCLFDDAFDAFERVKRPTLSAFATMTA
ncbi:2,3-bisphosphoglycerate-independent phosphoglycerate mutase, partial [Desulfovibrio sp. OttesenSCG-928-M14]|nr:2,3-bisphosphoglycerate-independent phosphoglycerate mutase [Desulfovibrio sp. OttesenSCG-928-M14]